MAERNIIFLRSEGDLVLRIDDGQPADAQALGRALDCPATLCWTGVTVPAGVFDHLDFWLATMDGFCRLFVQSQAIDRGLAAPAFEWGSMGVFDRDTFAFSPGARPGPSGGRGAAAPCPAPGRPAAVARRAPGGNAGNQEEKTPPTRDGVSKTP